MNDERFFATCITVVLVVIASGLASCTILYNQGHRDAVIAVCGGDLTEPARAVACNRISGGRN